MSLNKPTPQNIVSITYQLLQEVNNPNSIRGQMPILTIQFQDADSILRNKVVAFIEMLPYLRMLKERATVAGKLLICEPETTYDKKIVITYGDPTTGQGIVIQVGLAADNVCGVLPSIAYIGHAAPFIIGDILYSDPALTIPITGFNLVNDVTTGIIYGLDSLTGEILAATGNTCVIPLAPFNVSMQLNGVAFTATENLTAVSNCSISGNDTAVIYPTVPAIFTFSIPRKAGTFGVNNTILNEYTFPVGSLVNAIPNGLNWDVTLIWNSTGAIVLNVLSNDVIVVNSINGDDARGLQCALWDASFQRLYPFSTKFGTQRTQVLPRMAAFEIQYFTAAGNNGTMDLYLYDAANILLSVSENVYTQQAIAIPANCVRIDMAWRKMQFSNDIVGSAGIIFIMDVFAGYNGYGIITNESGALTELKYPFGGNGFNVGIVTLNPALLPYNVTFYKKGVALNTVAVNTQIFTAISSTVNFDTLVFGTGAPPPITGNMTVDTALGFANLQINSVGGITNNVVYPVLNNSHAGSWTAFAGGDLSVEIAGVTGVCTLKCFINGVQHGVDIPVPVAGFYNIPAVPALASGDTIEVIASEA